MCCYVSLSLPLTLTLLLFLSHHYNNETFLVQFAPHLCPFASLLCCVVPDARWKGWTLQTRQKNDRKTNIVDKSEAKKSRGEKMWSAFAPGYRHRHILLVAIIFNLKWLRLSYAHHTVSFRSNARAKKNITKNRSFCWVRTTDGTSNNNDAKRQRYYYYYYNHSNYHFESHTKCRLSLSRPHLANWRFEGRKIQIYSLQRIKIQMTLTVIVANFKNYYVNWKCQIFFRISQATKRWSFKQTAITFQISIVLHSCSCYLARVMVKFKSIRS